MSRRSERVVEIEGLRLTALCWGEPSAPPLLCLHGWLDNAASFAPLAPWLQEYQLIALELPGHGHSAHLPSGVAYHSIDSVVQVMAAVESLGIQQFSLMGHSMGAGIAALLAGTFPERVERLVLIESTGPRPGVADKAPRLLREYIVGRQRLREYPVVQRGASLEIALRARLSAAFPLGEAAAAELVQRGVKPLGDGVVFRADRRLHLPGPSRLTEAEIQAFLRAITCPTLLIQGDTGLRLPEHIAAERLRSLCDVRVEELPGGHHVHMDNPQAVGPVLRRFLGLGPLLGGS